ncbi:acyl-CoA dehydrogenase C-terminal domain-containing protein [Pseudohaliea rubra]|uniref:3-methylmercaptopropionyl-CoA dehydrogenase n=1 Tax=Pseudohaliea rubra DSM 19751 TaxID=1265313 RepID=A0A095XXC7_9GAMM|nr:acyl-CoA dehydrogenase C-terminal domain-containing protein [Pseudohaliea rubra]KGE04376.1 Acyl-CoA dehydrogenase [Pseudohaliea rubra DSM 19751]
MIQYRCPLRDFEFALYEVLGYEQHLATLQGPVTPERADARAILEAAAAFAEKRLVPINQSGDAEGCRLLDDHVQTPAGFREAYAQYRDGGWTGLSRAPEWGGSGLPASLGVAVTEVFATANWSWSMYPGLASGAMDTLEAFGTAAQQARYLPPLVSGQWTATMCLTEPQCGSDLAQVRMQATPDPAGHYRLNGSKIFITAGDHDLAENIVHIVLARLPDGPAGTRGLSLFVVPKHLPNVDGSLGRRNGVRCGGLEEKMGLKASATCTLHFDDAEAELLGEPHRGLECMFVFMNAARIGAGQQGVVHAELGYQNALAYTHERLAMRAPGGNSGPAPIILHADVRRMLLLQRAIAEGGRLLVLEAACLLDTAAFGRDEARGTAARDRLAFLTPIIKGFLTELGIEAADLALQCLGGHGYIREWGLEQNLRDARIATIYEGTTGIQALDLLGRKVVRDGAQAVQREAQTIAGSCERAGRHPQLADAARTLRDELFRWVAMSESLVSDAGDDPLVVPAAATDYLMYSGYLLLGHGWLRAADAAAGAIAAGCGDVHHESKLATATFYFARIFPRVVALREMIGAGPEALVAAADPALRPAEREPSGPPIAAMSRA